MGNWEEDFESILNHELIPDFCSDPRRGLVESNFVSTSVRVSEVDGRDFVRAWKGGLLHRERAGLYRATRSTASEQFFWTGRKQPGPRSFTLWLEPIITVAGLARLHWDFGWPTDLIGTQSSDWAFDLVSFHQDSLSEHIAGEIKKSRIEVDQLIELMRGFGQDPGTVPPASGKARNAYKKMEALRSRQPPVFWALGPGAYGKVYRVEYGPAGLVELVLTNDDELFFEQNCTRI